MNKVLGELNDFYSEVDLEKNIRVQDGHFGKLKVYKHRTTQKLFIEKQINIKDYNPMEPYIHQKMEKNKFFIKLYYSITSLRTHVLIMDYVKSEDLFSVRDKYGKMSEEETKQIVSQLTEALFYLHGYKIIHNDVKLENILYVRHKQIYLCDYGLAQILGSPSDHEGTIAYFSPEKIQEKPHDYSFDWWAVGVVTYELLTEKHPYVKPDEIYYEEDLFKRQQIRLSYIPYVSKLANAFIEKMLKFNYNFRLINGEEILSHSFLSTK